MITSSSGVVSTRKFLLNFGSTMTLYAVGGHYAMTLFAGARSCRRMISNGPAEPQSKDKYECHTAR